MFTCAEFYSYKAITNAELWATMFNVLHLVNKDVIRNFVGEPIVWESGQSAQQYCDDYNLLYSPQYNKLKVVQPLKIVENKDWKEREKARFASGEYVLPDFLKPYDLPDHFLHISKEKNAVCYTKDELKGRQDSQTRTSLTTYLEKFFPHLEKTVKRKVLEEFDMYQIDKTGFSITMDGNEISTAYLNYNRDCVSVSSSCMRNSFPGFPHHPVYIYGAGDLGLAFIKGPTGRTEARCLVWPEKKIHSRIYADKNILTNILKSLGYQKSHYYGSEYEENNFNGAKLLKVSFNSEFLMPYIDEPYIQVVDEGKFFVMKKVKESHLMNARNTNGTFFRGHLAPCERCAIECFTAEMGVGYDNLGFQHRLCMICFNQHTFFCPKTEERFTIFPGREHPTVTLENGETWSVYAFSKHGFVCQKTGQKRSTNQRRIVITPTGNQYWCVTAIAQFGWKCALSAQNFSNEIEPGFFHERKYKVCKKAAIKAELVTEDGIHFFQPKGK